MFSGIYQSITILVVVLVFYIMDFILIHRYDRQRQEVKSGRSWDYTLLMFVVTAVVILQPIFLPKLSLFISKTWGLAVQVVGLMLAACALVLHTWARLHLRHFYAERVEVLPNHQVIDTGPYALMRHPVITSFFMLAISLFLINPSIATLIVLVYTFWDFSRAARQEEELLSKTLPDYTAYMERTSRFLPRLWRRK